MAQSSCPNDRQRGRSRSRLNKGLLRVLGEDIRSMVLVCQRDVTILPNTQQFEPLVDTQYEQEIRVAHECLLSKYSEVSYYLASNERRLV